MYLGTDPEFIAQDATGKALPAWKWFPDKEHKLRVGNHNLFRDGFAMEVNVLPSDCRETLAHYVLEALTSARKILPEGVTLTSRPAVPVDLNEILHEAPMDAMVFGCEPSWNARTGEFSSVPLDATEHAFRYAGGHMHIAWGKVQIDSCNHCASFQWVKEPEQAQRFVQLLDRYVGLPLSVWFNKPETFQRRKYYGQAGDFRFQSYDGAWYGIEYRTPGPEIWNSPVVASFAFGAMRAVAQQFKTLSQNFDEGLDRDIAHAVNTGEGALALLPKGYIDFLGNNRKKFTEIIAHERPFQQLLTIRPQRIGQSVNPALIGWAQWDRTYDFAASR